MRGWKELYKHAGDRQEKRFNPNSTEITEATADYLKCGGSIKKVEVSKENLVENPAWVENPRLWMGKLK